MTDRIPVYGSRLSRAPYPLPKKRKPTKSGIARAPKRVWLRHRKFVRSHECCVDGCHAPAQFAHIRTAENSGTGLKPHDRFGVPLCLNHHQEQHQVGQGTFEDRHGLDLDAIAAELVRRSPDQAMRVALLVGEDAAPPQRVGPRDAAGRDATRPEALPAASIQPSATAQAFRLAAGHSRLSRLIPIVGFVS